MAYQNRAPQGYPGFRLRDKILEQVYSKHEIIRLYDIIPFKWDTFINLPPGISRRVIHGIANDIPKTSEMGDRWIFLYKNKVVHYELRPWVSKSEVPEDIHVIFGRNKITFFVINKKDAIFSV